MDIELARTFIQISATGSFARAAERLNLTQSTISMRVRNLEGQLGRRLFVRSKAGAVLTPDGVRFQRFAATLVQVWEQARHDIAVPLGFRKSFSIGSQISLWDQLLLKLLPWVVSRAPDVALRAELNLPDGLMIQLIEGVLDVGIMYMPQRRPGLSVEILFEEELILVRTVRSKGQPNNSRYNFINVDWGPEFSAFYREEFSGQDSATISVGQGLLALNYILENGGTGYFPRRVVDQKVETGDLTFVEGAPTFPYPVYVVHRLGADPELLDIVLAGLNNLSN